MLCSTVIGTSQQSLYQRQLGIGIVQTYWLLVRQSSQTPEIYRRSVAFPPYIKRLMEHQHMACEQTKNRCFSLMRELAFSMKFQTNNSCRSQRRQKLLLLDLQEINHGANVYCIAKECPCACQPAWGNEEQ